MTSQPVDRRRLTVRRAPKYVPFMVAGALVGVVVAGILTLISPSVEKFDPGSIFGFFAVLLMLPGLGMGAAAALVIDRRSVKRAGTAVVESVPDDEHGAAAGRQP